MLLLAPLLASGWRGFPGQTASGWPRVSKVAAVVSSRVRPSSGVGKCCSMGKGIRLLSTACSLRFPRVWTVSGRVLGGRFQQGAASLCASARDRPAQSLAAGMRHHLSSATAILPKGWCQVSMCGFGQFRPPNAASKGRRRGSPNPRSLGLSRETPSGAKVEHRFEEKWFPPDTAASCWGVNINKLGRRTPERLYAGGHPLFMITACCLLVHQHWTRVFVPQCGILRLVCMYSEFSY